MRTSLLAAGCPNPESSAPPVPTTNSRMPRLGSAARWVLRREPLVAVLVAGQDHVGAVLGERVPEGTDVGVGPVRVPEVKSGWCQ